MPKPRILSLCPLAIRKTLSFYTAPRKAGKSRSLKRTPGLFRSRRRTELITADDPCNYNVRYRSVIGYGQAKSLEDYSEKVRGLIVLSEHYGKMGPFEFEAGKVNSLCVIIIEIEKMNGKESGF